MTEDDWLTVAMSDNDVVAELLLKLRLATLPPPPPSSSKRRRPSPPQSWTIHQRRSRTQPLSNKSETPRSSPTTPLSWTGGDQISDAHNCSSDIVRPPGETTPTKRPRKKKTLAALKEEGILLMEEQNDLKKKLAALQANCEKQRKENEMLKKIKLDLQRETPSERPKTMRNNHFEVVNEQNDKAVLPDLNVPFGEDVIVSC